MPPVLFQNERTATGFWYFATGGVPNPPEKFSYVYQIPGWVSEVRIHSSFYHPLISHSLIIQKQQKYRALLLMKERKVPLLWKVLANKYSGTDIIFGMHRDRKGRSSIEMGLEVGGKKEAKILLYPIGSTTPFRYRGSFSSSRLLNYKSNFLKQAFSNMIHSLNSLTPSWMVQLTFLRSSRRPKKMNTLRIPKRPRSRRNKRHNA